jgi:hypothetical protein
MTTLVTGEAVVLLDEGHDGRRYSLTGGVPVSTRPCPTCAGARRTRSRTGWIVTPTTSAEQVSA